MANTADAPNALHSLARDHMKRSTALAAVAACVVFVLAGCTIRLISEYDETTDAAVTQLQTDVAEHLAVLKGFTDPETGKPSHPKCEFKNFGDTYAQLAAKAHVLVVRNESRPKNGLTTDQLKLLEQSIGEHLVGFHRDADGECLTAGAIDTAGEALDQNFRAILKLELAKKQYREGK